MKEAIRAAAALVLGLLLITPARDLEAANPAAGGSEKEDTLWIIPHTHWEGAVFKTREEYLEMGLSHILTALCLLKEHPGYRFALDQVAYFRPFLERYPTEASSFRKFVAEGRLQIVGGMDVMPDDNMPSGESFVRQMLYAKGYCREALGVEVKTAWLLDTFGHHSQLPQLLRQGGFETFWFARGVESRASMPTEFWWEGLDGTRIRAFWLPYSYVNFASPPKDLAQFSAYAKKAYADLAPYARNPHRVAFNGADVTDPDMDLPGLVRQFNAQPGQPVLLRLAAPAEFEAVHARRTDLPTVRGERNPLFQGVYSSRIELKQRMREMERLLATAEKFSAIANWLGAATDEGMTWRAWEPVLFNVAHDLASGVMTDPVYEDTVRSYESARRLADELVETRLDAILARVDTEGKGVPLAVCNTLGWTRTDVAEGDAGFGGSGIADFDLLDPAGYAVPAQVVEEERFANGGLRRVKFVFVARDVPALGHAIYHVVPRQSAGAPQHPVVARGAGLLENDFFRVDVDLRNGALRSLRTSDGDWEALSGPANVVAVEPDHGDVWELNRTLDGAQNLIMTRPLPVPRPGGALFSSDAVSTDGVVRRGPVFSETEVSLPLGTNSLFMKTRLCQGIRRVDFETRILNRDRFVRYRMLVPTSLVQGRNVQEIPFGAVERPQSQEFPAQNWVDCSGSGNGLAVLNRGNPGNNVADGTIMLSLMRSTAIQSYGIGGGFEGQPSDSALELGRELTLRYALMPHKGDWRDARVYRAGLEFNNPLVVRKVASHQGALPRQWGFLEVSPSNVVISALKPGRDGATVLRVYEASGVATQGAKVKFNARVRSACEVNLIEAEGTKVPARENTLKFDLRPFEIRTYKLHLSPLKQGRTG